MGFDLKKFEQDLMRSANQVYSGQMLGILPADLKDKLINSGGSVDVNGSTGLIKFNTPDQKVHDEVVAFLSRKE